MVLRCAARVTDGSSLRICSKPLLSVMVIDRLKDEVGEESLWTMTFTDNALICSERRVLPKWLERWRYALKRRGMKVSRSKTE